MKNKSLEPAQEKETASEEKKLGDSGEDKGESNTLMSNLRNKAYANKQKMDMSKAAAKRLDIHVHVHQD